MFDRIRSSLTSFKVKRLHSRARALVDKFEQGGESRYIDEAIALDRKSLGLCSSSHPERLPSLVWLSVDLGQRHSKLGAVVDLEEVIVFEREALALCPPGYPDRSSLLAILAVHLSIRYDQLRAMGDLEEAILLFRESLSLCPPRYSDRSTSLDNLAVRLSNRYHQLGTMEDLEEAILLGQESLSLRPPGHPNRSTPLNNLAVDLSCRYDQLGAIEDLEEAILLGRESLSLRPPGHPDRSTSLNNLAGRLSTRYEQLRAMEDLEEAILLGRESLSLCLPGYPNRSASLNGLGVYLLNRYDQLGAMEDLEEAILLGRESLSLCPPGHPEWSKLLNNLAVDLSYRYDQLGAMEDLEEAILLSRESLSLRPPGHPDRSTSLNCLGVYLSNRYDQLGAMEDLGEAILFGRESLSLCPPGHPNRSTSLTHLAIRLSGRYDRLGATEDSKESIPPNQDAPANCSQKHADRSTSTENPAPYRQKWFPQLSQSREESFNLYTQLTHVTTMGSSADLSAVKIWIREAERFDHPTIALAYETYLRLLTHHLATLPSLPQHRTVLKDLTSSLAVDAFSACLRQHSPVRAVEFLEQGRGVFWSQLTRLRSSLDDVFAVGSAGKMLGNQFTQLTSRIWNALNSPGAHQHDQVCNLNAELAKVVANIRGLLGLSRFLLPPLFCDLQQAACEGPVIIVNASQYGCDAFVVLVNQDPVHIPLSITRRDVRELPSKLGGLTAHANSMDVKRGLGVILRELWNVVVSPIVDFLQTILPSQSRIWWCPTAEFSLLPLHAAGPYRPGQCNLADFYLSSYTPTLTALIRARRYGFPPSSTTKRFVAMGQAKAKEEVELVSVGAELAIVRQCVDGLATFTCIEGDDSCIARVGEELGKNEWVHLACHGIPDREQPFQSAFALHDGHFTIEHIIRCELENPEFAYLSACHTTVGDEESLDEAIHLASAMQFIGFRSVVGTMWAVDDCHTNMITSMFYDNIKDESGHLDYTRAAFALNKTMRNLVDIPFDQRILYIHLGA